MNIIAESGKEIVMMDDQDMGNGMDRNMKKRLTVLLFVVKSDKVKLYNLFDYLLLIILSIHTLLT